MIQLSLLVLEERLAVARLPPDAEVPVWAGGSFTSITRSEEELSIVCADRSVPEDFPAERGWRVLKVRGPIPFETTGVAAALVSPLATAGISVFLISTFDTDYLLVKEDHFEDALATLRAAGHDAA